MIEVHRGSVQAWECDNNAHLNVRFFMEKAWQGMAGLSLKLGLGSPFSPRAEHLLQMRDVHIRFLRELRSGAGLSVHAGAVAMGDDNARLLLEVRHNDGTPGAAYTFDVAHVRASDGAAVPFSAHTRATLNALRIEPQAHALPRSIDTKLLSDAKVSLAHADALGLRTTGRYAVRASYCDPFGNLLPEHFIGRISDSMPNVRYRAPYIRANEGARGGDGVRRGGAAIEYRVAVRSTPRVGDFIEMRSSIVDVAEKYRRMRHWLLDPITGNAWATAEIVAVSMDLTTRKMIALSEDEREAVMAAAVPAMGM
jgi:acyl-CoA thioester hydrolase